MHVPGHLAHHPSLTTNGLLKSCPSGRLDMSLKWW